MTEPSGWALSMMSRHGRARRARARRSPCGSGRGRAGRCTEGCPETAFASRARVASGTHPAGRWHAPRRAPSTARTRERTDDSPPPRGPEDVGSVPMTSAFDFPTTWTETGRSASTATLAKAWTMPSPASMSLRDSVTQTSNVSSTTTVAGISAVATVGAAGGGAAGGGAAGGGAASGTRGPGGGGAIGSSRLGGSGTGSGSASGSGRASGSPPAPIPSGSRRRSPRSPRAG